MMELLELKEAALEQVVRPSEDGTYRPVGERPVVLDFYVPWCQPCRTMLPVLEEVAEEYAGRVDFYKIDIDRERRIAVRFRVRNVPALAFLSSDGVSGCRVHVGALTRASLRERVEALLASSC
ncbi:thioredoxin domain-containing protein [uncultured Rikenella sp.]|uniref:thioredoxin family protein n=1 Tax=uncultured Rikenella sp. TaxID=368003 RepID=UPI0026047852|nr:thioredoxin domain-containing protein [uncultured Rikenella sp.]